MGERLRPVAARLEGYDISAEMLCRAEAKKVYDRQRKTDLLTMNSGPPADLVVAADVFMYLGALDSVVALALRAAAGGLSPSRSETRATGFRAARPQVRAFGDYVLDVWLGEFSLFRFAPRSFATIAARDWRADRRDAGGVVGDSALIGFDWFSRTLFGPSGHLSPRGRGTRSRFAVTPALLSLGSSPLWGGNGGLV